MKPVLIVLSLIVFNTSSLYAAPADGNSRVRFYGEISPDASSRMTVKQIEATGISTLKAYNPYEKKTDSYTGVWLKQLVKHLAKPGINSVTLKAIDDYEVDFTADEWEKIRIMLVTRVNGQYIGFEQKGPMKVIFPDFNADEKLYQDTLPKWMWMITKIEFK